MSELSTSWAMPRPPSLISTMVLSPACLVEIFTGAVGGENARALSTSSVIRCTTSAAAAPLTFSGGEDSIWTRWYSCTPAIAAWNTSPRASASVSLVCVGASASTISESAVRRMREARWSSRNRHSSRFGSSSSFSSRSIRPSCWLISEVLRRDRVENISPTCERSLASPDARCTACRCRSSTARASWPISSWVVHGDRDDLARVFAGPDLGDHLRQPGVGDLERTLAHPADRVQQQAGDQQGQEDRGEQQRDGDHGVGDGQRRARRWRRSVRFLSMSLSRSTLRSS